MREIFWYKATVTKGHKVGRTIGFPTINLDPAIFSTNQQEGVYASLVMYQGEKYTGALYLGPRDVFGEHKRVLEIYLLNFDKTIYGEKVKFALLKQIRGLVSLPSIAALQEQMQKDIQEIQEVVTLVFPNDS